MCLCQFIILIDKSPKDKLDSEITDSSFDKFSLSEFAFEKDQTRQPNQ